MLIHKLATLTGIAVVGLLLASPASALSMSECSTKYNAAKEAGSLDGKTWNQFRKAECGSDASAAKDDSKSSKKTKTKADSEKPAKKAAASDDAGNGLSMKECSAKYQAAKAADTLNGMKWNTFRKEECGPGASAAADTAAKPAKTTKTKKASTDDDAGNGLSMKECSAKYQAAKAAGTLNGMKWNAYRKEECGPGASAAAETAAKPAKTTTTKKAAADDSAGKGLTMKECSSKYQAAKNADTLNGMNWNAFRKAECSADAADDDTVPAASEAKYDGEPTKPTAKAPRGVKFPTAVSQKYQSESPGKARMHTCLDQYYANKDNNALGDLKWIQKGGGFYSLCNARLKNG